VTPQMTDVAGSESEESDVSDLIALQSAAPCELCRFRVTAPLSFDQRECVRASKHASDAAAHDQIEVRLEKVSANRQRIVRFEQSEPCRRCQFHVYRSVQLEASHLQCVFAEDHESERKRFLDLGGRTVDQIARARELRSALDNHVAPVPAAAAAVTSALTGAASVTPVPVTPAAVSPAPTESERKATLSIAAVNYSQLPSAPAGSTTGGQYNQLPTRAGTTPVFSPGVVPPAVRPYGKLPVSSPPTLRPGQTVPDGEQKQQQPVTKPRNATITGQYGFIPGMRPAGNEATATTTPPPRRATLTTSGYDATPSFKETKD
jgi:hypothetical protein